MSNKKKSIKWKIKQFTELVKSGKPGCTGLG